MTGSVSPAPTVRDPQREDPREEGESMSVDMEEEPVREGSDSDDSDDDYVYAPLRPYMEEIKSVLSEGLVRSLQLVHDRLVERVRARPCIFSGPFCVGKEKKARPPTTSAARHVTVSERILLVDASSQAAPQGTESEAQTDSLGTDRETQTQQRGTDKATQTETAANDDDGKKAGEEETTSPQLSPKDSTKDKENRRDRQQREDRRAHLIDRERILAMVGWHTIAGRPTYVSAPKPGCWACGRGEGHRLNNCPYRPVGYRYCYHCGLGGVTVKDCPLHGEGWAAEGPYLHQLGRNLPRERRWQDEPDYRR